MELHKTTPKELNATIRMVHERFIESLEAADEGEPVSLRDEFDRNYP